MKHILYIIISVLVLISCSDNKDEFEISQGNYIKKIRGYSMVYGTSDDQLRTFTYDDDMKVISSTIKTEFTSEFLNINGTADFSYYPDGKIKSIGDFQFTYNENGFNAINPNDTMYRLEYHNDGDSCSLRNYYKTDFYPYEQTSSTRFFDFDNEGNIIFKDDDIPEILGTSYINIVRERLGYGEFQYDDKRNRYWNIPFEVKMYFGFNTGDNNPTLFNGNFRTLVRRYLIHKYLYNKNNLPALIKTYEYELNGNDTILTEIYRTEIEYQD